ncbi:hypothetical protein KIW84_051993 [Lathyrus oleraceus]|uniref:Uncharacterized protein n=1 Tax=Pisum sativum TaxID=3888 RepID=A0A9D4WNQ3_PEA|nr:hypothetical protein KIW84_051993 [Pisum sativum]
MRTTELARNNHRRLLILIINQKHELHNVAIFIFYQGHCVPNMKTWEDYEGRKKLNSEVVFSETQPNNEAIMPFLEELLTSYVDEVFSYISVAFCNQIGKPDQPNDSNSRSNLVHSEIKEQYTRVGGVAVEFCCHDMLGFLPPGIMQELVELIEDSNAMSSRTASNSVSKQPYLNLYLLLEFDIEATLDVLRFALMEDKISNSSSSSLDSADKAIDEETKENNSVTKTENILVQNTVDALIQITDMNVAPSDTTSSVGDDGLTKEWPSNGGVREDHRPEFEGS